MSIASNRINGTGMWGMTVDHIVMMIRDPDLYELPWEPIAIYLSCDEVEASVTSDEVVVTRPHG